MKIIIIVQARMGSSRLPGKMMMEMGGKPVIAHVIERAQRSTLAEVVWLSTTVSPADDVLASWANDHGVHCYRGSENDVLDRYYQTAREAEADVVVRVTGDCPLIDAEILDQVIGVYIENPGKYDYVSNIFPPTFPDGLDVELVPFLVLERAWKEATLVSEREHVMPYIWGHPEIFRLHNVSRSPDFSQHRWTLDTPEDFAFLQLVISEQKNQGGYLGLESLLQIIGAHPEWTGLNAHLKRNEGYEKSLQEDKKV